MFRVLISMYINLHNKDRISAINHKIQTIENFNQFLLDNKSYIMDNFSIFSIWTYSKIK
jgi:hypothetical protein